MQTLSSYNQSSVLLFLHRLVADAIVQGGIVQACAGYSIGWCDDGAWDFEPAGVENITGECIQIKRHGVWSDVSVNGYNRAVGPDDVCWPCSRAKDYKN